SGPGASLESHGDQHRRFKLTRDLKKRLDRYLRDRLPSLSRSRLQKLINEGAVTVNGRTPKSSTLLGLGDVVDVQVPPPPLSQIPAEPIPLDVLYEDEHLIVVNKQADLIVHPARSNPGGTMVNALAWYFREVKPNGLEALSSVGVDEFRPGVIHRLDKDTTGAIVVAKTDEAHWRMNRQFETRAVQKYYLAVVHGEMSPPGDVIDGPIGKHLQVAEAYAVRHDRGGRGAVTIYRVREVFDGYSLVELELKTGRTHQIRVHLTWLGFPIVSDIIYGGEAMGEPEMREPPVAAGSQPHLTFARQKPEGLRLWKRIAERDDLLIDRPALHATVLQFRHPVTEAPVQVTAPLPKDMAELVRSLRKQRPKSGLLPADGAQVQMDRVLLPPD
ncbi:MAG: RluA family pseudouridine synthase, partial [Phycisphaerae bacterium]|nr:RluA family pseudouridine synthase [Phycisphaerae bacterium]